MKLVGKAWALRPPLSMVSLMQPRLLTFLVDPAPGKILRAGLMLRKEQLMVPSEYQPFPQLEKAGGSQRLTFSRLLTSSPSIFFSHSVLDKHISLYTFRFQVPNSTQINCGKGPYKHP